MTSHLDADLADVTPALEIFERGAQLSERKRAVDHRTNRVQLHGGDHRGELVAIANGDSVQSRGLHDQDREVEIVPGAGHDTNDADGPAHADCAKRLPDGAATD